jgi:hypothetical protein
MDAQAVSEMEGTRQTRQGVKRGRGGEDGEGAGAGAGADADDEPKRPFIITLRAAEMTLAKHNLFASWIVAKTFTTYGNNKGWNFVAKECAMPADAALDRSQARRVTAHTNQVERLGRLYLAWGFLRQNDLDFVYPDGLTVRGQIKGWIGEVREYTSLSCFRGLVAWARVDTAGFLDALGATKVELRVGGKTSTLDYLPPSLLNDDAVHLVQRSVLVRDQLRAWMHPFKSLRQLEARYNDAGAARARGAFVTLIFAMLLEMLAE